MNRAVTPEEQREVRINVRVKGPMAAHLESVMESLMQSEIPCGTRMCRQNQ